MTAEFLLTSLVVIILPGTGVLYTLACGLGRGRRESLFAAFGCTLGIVPHIAASILGLAAILNASAHAFEVLRYLGVAYLFYMAWSVLRAGGIMEIDGQRAAEGPWRIVANGVLLNLLNPKLTLFFLAFLPQFIPPQADHATLRMLGLSAVFMGLTFIVFAAYGAFAAAARAHIVSRPSVVRWMGRGFATAFVVLGIRLAVPDR